MKATKKIFIFSFFFLFLFSQSFSVFAANSFDYKPLERLPINIDENRPGDFYDYIELLYQFLIGAAGICALLMIVIGGFMYSTSAGNNAAMEKAKGVVTDAIIGLLLVMTSWLLLYIINPDLVAIKRIPSLGKGTTSATSPSGYVSTMNLPIGCSAPEWQSMFSATGASRGTDPCLLKATVAAESSCTQIPPRRETKNGTICGSTQMLAEANCGASCDALESNPQQAIDCSADYYKKNCAGKARGEKGGEQYMRDLYACYHGGPGALAPSTDCSGVNSYGYEYRAWDCPTNQGGYVLTDKRTMDFYKFYTDCKNQS